MKTLDEMTREELKAYAKQKGIRLYTVAPDKMREKIRELEHARATKGDAFRTKR